MTNKPTNNSIGKEKMQEILFKYYIKSRATDKTVQKMKKIMEHELTCDDLSHGHGIVKVRWDKPSNEEQKEIFKL